MEVFNFAISRFPEESRLYLPLMRIPAAQGDEEGVKNVFQV